MNHYDRRNNNESVEIQVMVELGNRIGNHLTLLVTGGGAESAQRLFILKS